MSEMSEAVQCLQVNGGAVSGVEPPRCVRTFTIYRMHRAACVTERNDDAPMVICGVMVVVRTIRRICGESIVSEEGLTV
jgi:hypothetical protein